MYRQFRVIFGAAATVAAAACASSTASGTSAARVDANVVTGEELVRVGDVNLLEALRQIRPNFLRVRGQAGTTFENVPVTVFVGTQRMEGIDHLREIMVKSVIEVRHYDAQRANARFGGNNAAGALLVVLK